MELSDKELGGANCLGCMIERDGSLNLIIDQDQKAFKN
jgi:hypothetical protein